MNLYKQISQELKAEGNKGNKSKTPGKSKSKSDKNTKIQIQSKSIDDNDKNKKKWKNAGISQTANANTEMIVINYTKISTQISKEQEYAETKIMI